MSNQANFIATTYPLHELNLGSDSTKDIKTEWSKEIQESHDAHYILRKRSLLLDLWNLETPFETEWKECAISNDKQADQTLKNIAQENFLKEIIEEKSLWFQEISTQTMHARNNTSKSAFLNTEEFPYKVDSSWHLDCFMTVQ